MNLFPSLLARRTRLSWGLLPLALVGALLFAACGGGATTTSTPTATTQPTSAPTATATSQPSPSSTTASSSTTDTVKIIETNGVYSFNPKTLSIKAGTQVKWENTTDAPHTVTSDSAGVFGSPGNITENRTFTFTFAKAGTFPYHCNIHPYMKATITVTS
jgi:plastocyanin